MSLDVTKLERARELTGGIVQAQCPACAEAGSDRSGEHLRVYPDGKFGCCVHPKDLVHRKRIFALAGDREPRGFMVKVRKPLSLSVESVKQSLELFSGTFGTGLSMSRAYARENNIHHIYKDNETGVPSVPNKTIEADIDTAVPSVPQFPFLASDGTLIIPFNSPVRYHWWNGGQSLSATRLEAIARKEQDASPF